MNVISRTRPDAQEIALSWLKSFAEALQANAAWRTIPVIVVTALDLTAEDRRRLNGGVEQILSKHAFPPAELMARVGALLGETRKAQK